MEYRESNNKKRMIENGDLLIFYFHSHTLDEVFPCSSDSYSNTPTKLLRKASLPFEDALKNSEPMNLIFPEPVNLPTP
jgi:hypothetical protein